MNDRQSHFLSIMLAVYICVYDFNLFKELSAMCPLIFSPIKSYINCSFKLHFKYQR